MPPSRAPSKSVMSLPRALSLLLATLCFLAAPLARAQMGIAPITDQYIPSGKTLVVPIPATDPTGPPRTYTVTTGSATIVSGSTTLSATSAGILATIRTGDPHFVLGVSYSDTTGAVQTGTMEFQLLREFAPKASEIIGGLAQAGFYSPTGSGSNINYLEFFRVVPGFVIQGGAPTNSSSYTPGFSFENEYSSALIFSGSLGQLAMANSNTNINSAGNSINNGNTNGTQFFITLTSDRSDLDYGYTIFGQLLRGADTLTGIGNTPVTTNTNTNEDSLPVNPVNITSAALTQNDTDAVLLLSATGICDAAITVTASSGTNTVTQTFMAHAVNDTIDDPPFAQPPTSITAPNGTAKITVQAADLEYDLIRYGYQRFLPAPDSGITSGTSPTLPIPLVSNTANIIGANVDSWNPSTRGYNGFPFQVGAGAKPLRGSLAKIPPGFGNTLTFDSQPLVTFTSANPKDTPASFTASVNWGDGTAISGSQVNIVRDGSVSTLHRFQVLSSHVYKGESGEFPVIVNISDGAGASLTLNGTANVSPSTIAIGGADLYKTGGKFKNQLVATYSDNGGLGSAADYSATIDWGDGAVTPGVIKALSDITYQVLGTHNYLAPGNFTVSTTVARTTGGGASAYEWSTAHVAGVLAPQVLPPFPQAHLAQMWSPIYEDQIVFSGSTDGSNPAAPLVQGTNGNFYGTTENGGANGLGAIFEITSSGSSVTLYSFTGNSDGSNPEAGLVTGTDGNFYGTTTAGADGFGSIFQITPGGAFTPYYDFSGGADGGIPTAPLLAGANGLLYGTTSISNGGNDHGTIFSIAYNGAFTTLYSFTSGDVANNQGGAPLGGLVTGSDGNLYGTNSTAGASGVGTVFQYVVSSGTVNLLYTFTGGSDGGQPHAGLLSATDGLLYGTTTTGGGGGGTAFSISTTGSFAVLHQFSGGSDGGDPVAPLITGTDGNFYGTTEIGGSGSDGVVFQMTPDGTLNPLYSFTGGNDGSNPEAALVAGTDGNLYGTTFNGGFNGFGTVFQMSYAGGSVNTLHAFDNATGLQVALRCSVAIVNSGNVASGPASFAVYVDANGQLDGNQTAFTSDGQTSYSVPPLKPGQYSILSFQLEGSVVDSRLKLPVGFSPTGQALIGVVTYSDPVANFDGAGKIVSPGSF